MDDFYVYYEPKPNDVTKGIIKAVAPHEVRGIELEHIRIPSEQGLEFTVGSESLNLWLVSWDNDACEMKLCKVEPHTIINTDVVFFEELPRKQYKPQLTVTYSRSTNSFHLLTRRVSISHANVPMTFFVTRQGDANILYHHFTVDLYDTMRRGITIPCGTNLPKKFSVFTKPELEKYQLKVTK